MINIQKILRFQINNRLRKNAGFTLIELLVGMILAAIVITPLLSFMNNILATERQEQAKTNTEQQIQSAINYIAQDLKQAVYIYDADGLNNISSLASDTTSGIKDQIPPLAPAPGCDATLTCTPILVFWKREFQPDAITECTDDDSCATKDTFVYALVAYYLIKGNNADNWSNTARIGRFQIRDGVKDPSSPDSYFEPPSNGFQRFNLRSPSNTLKDKMNRWQKANDNYTDAVAPLVDFIAQNNTRLPNCPANTQQVPSTLAGGFYACVDSTNTTAQVYIQGNALARIQNDAACTEQQFIYCPVVNTYVQGRGLSNNN